MLVQRTYVYTQLSFFSKMMEDLERTNEPTSDLFTSHLRIYRCRW